MKLLPVALNVQNKNCLIVGGGAVAARKVASLLECTAKVTVIAPQLNNQFDDFQHICKYLQRTYESGDVSGFDLVFACTNAREINAQIGREACELGIWCNIADDASLSDFHGAAALRRDEICIGISTGGGSPALSKHLKAQISQTIGPEYEQLLSWMKTRRETLASHQTESERRGDLWRAVLGSDVLALCRSGEMARAEMLLDEILKGK